MESYGVAIPEDAELAAPYFGVYVFGKQELTFQADSVIFSATNRRSRISRLTEFYSVVRQLVIDVLKEGFQ